MMFAAGALGASWLWVLALVVARQYHRWKGYSGWAEIKDDVSRLMHSGGSSTSGESVGIGLLLGWSAAWGTFLYALSR